MNPLRAIRQLHSSALLWTLIATFLRFGGFVLVLPIIVRSVPSDTLGFYFTFLSLAAFAALIDLGFGPTISRSAGFFLAGSRELQTHGIAAPTPDSERKPNLNGLKSLVAAANGFYRLGALVVLLSLATAGSAWIWQHTSGLADAQIIRAAWVLQIIAVAYGFFGYAWPALLTGINAVRESQQIFISSLVINYAVVLGGLFLGWGIWALVGGQFIQAIISRETSRYFFYRRLGTGFHNAVAENPVGLFKTMWPIAWKNGLLSASLYLFLGFPILLSGQYLGMAATASLSICFQLVFALVQVSSAGLIVKIPYIHQLRARMDTEAVRAIFIERLWMFLLLYGLGGLGIVLAGPFIFVHLIGSQTTLPAAPVLIAVVIYFGIEALQSHYRGIYITTNRMPNGLLFATVGVACSAAAAFSVQWFGMVGLLLPYILIKGLTLDIPVIQAGFATMGASWKQFGAEFLQFPGAQLRRFSAQGSHL